MSHIVRERNYEVKSEICVEMENMGIRKCRSSNRLLDNRPAGE